MKTITRTVGFEEIVEDGKDHDIQIIAEHPKLGRIDIRTGPQIVFPNLDQTVEPALKKAYREPLKAWLEELDVVGLRVRVKVTLIYVDEEAATHLAAGEAILVGERVTTVDEWNRKEERFLIEVSVANGWKDLP